MRELSADEGQFGASSGNGRTADGAVLVVGATDAWLKRERRIPTGGRIILTCFCDFSRHLLDRLHPKTVVSPVLAQTFDCIDLAQILYALGYTGEYRVMLNDMPDLEVVLGEIRSLCPGLDIGVLGATAAEKAGIGSA